MGNTENQTEESLKILSEVGKNMQEQVAILGKNLSRPQEVFREYDRLIVQCRNLTTAISAMEGRIKQDVSIKKKLEIDLLAQQSDQEGRIKHLHALLINKENSHLKQLKELEEMYKKSWKWKIGNLFVETFISAFNLLKNPVRFISSSEYRGTWKGYNSRISSSVPLSFNKDSLNPSLKKNAPPEIEVTPPENVEVPKVIKKDPRPSDQTNIPPEKVMEKTSNPLIAAVFDEFTMACFSPECALLTFRPDNWKEKVEEHQPDIILVESAWHGNQGSWQYKIAKYARNMGDELRDLVLWAKERKIPTVFWNKEDPPNFDRFIDKAGLFDYVFTSDEECIPRYRQILNHDRIYSLAFAAQPAIHSPICEGPRNGKICFAGTYHADEYLERQNDMEVILNPSLDYDLDIFDRNYGSAGPGSERFRFPEKYQPAIRGRLNYDEMVKAYHRYQVFLNVNSVKTSPTMFSRRVFELLACGTPVISTYSKGIVDLLGETVFITESESDTRKHLDLLLNDAFSWMKASVKGIRMVMENHTYDRRLEHVFRITGIAGENEQRKVPAISLLIRISDETDFLGVAEKIKMQKLPPESVLLLSDHPLPGDQLEQFSSLIRPVRLHAMEFYQDKITQKISEEISSEYFVIWDQNDYYGPEFLADYVSAMKYSSSDYFGKGNYFSSKAGKVLEINNGLAFTRVNSVPISTLMFKRNKLGTFNLDLMNNPDGTFDLFVRDIISLDPLNFIKNQDKMDKIPKKEITQYFI